MVDLIKIRIEEGRCPICNREFLLNYKVIEDIHYGLVRICKHHSAGEDYED